MSQKEINITDLDLASLQQVKSQIEEEVSHLTQSYSKLKGVQSRFKDCSESVESLKAEKPDGKLSDVEKVIVDVGTGYYVEKSLGDATKFYNNKVDYVKKNMETLEKTITDKQSTLRAIIGVMQEKLQKEQK
ncbi:prefoldin, alpha subunit [Mycotypha africana]|uniref:prefoldin, alpha subunit n=1 Tax=Mycotypha africana TaxID=64632 RepID=UPI002301DDA7|nr:prefoldin, alpha subunit [Mycotypha africana]KAI8973402.1 prefoldin, alpha subunit [Mycotypha africana]